MSEQLKQHIDKIETLEAAKADIADEIKDQYALVKSDGFNPNAVKTVVARRKREREKVDALDSDVQTYEAALG